MTQEGSYESQTKTDCFSAGNNAVSKPQCSGHLRRSILSIWVQGMALSQQWLRHCFGNSFTLSNSCANAHSNRNACANGGTYLAAYGRAHFAAYGGANASAYAGSAAAHAYTGADSFANGHCRTCAKAYANAKDYAKTGGDCVSPLHKR